MDAFIRDLRHAIRGLFRAPGFTVVAVLTLALGIGATTATYSIVASSLTARIPVRELDRVVGLWSFDRTNGQSRVVVSPEDFWAWRERQRSFEDLSAMRFGGVNLSGIDQPVRASGAFVTASYFNVIGIQPAVGRPFTADENAPGGARVAILNNRTWRNRFGRRADIVGHTVRIDGRATTIVGVMPPDDFTPDVLQPLPIDPASPAYNQRSLLVAARMKPGVTVEQASAEVETIGRQLEEERPGTHKGWGIRAFPYREEFIGPTEQIVYVFLGLMALGVLFMGCTNIANLLLARGTERVRELAVRAAMGASRAHLIRQMLIESATLAAVGGVGGLFVAYGGLRLLMATFWVNPPIFLQDRSMLDAGFLWAVLGGTLVATLLFGMLPALHHGRAAAQALGHGMRSTGSKGMGRLRGALVASEVAAATLLLVIALLISRTMVNLLAVEPGFDTRNLLLLEVSLPAEEYAATETAAAFYDRVLARLAQSPGVVAAGAASRVPVEGGYLNPSRTLTVDGHPALNGETRAVEDLTVTSGYLETLRVPLLQGRVPTPDDGAGAQLTVVVSETTATRIWGARSPIGARVRLGDEPSPTAWRTVIGVVGDIRNDNINAPPPPYVYVPAAQRPAREMTFVLRTVDDPTAHVSAARAAVAAEDANLAVFDIQSMDQLLGEDLRGPAVLSSMTGIFAALALVLAAIGIYGMVAYAVAQRTRELAIRLAVGAKRLDIVRHVFGHGLGWVGSGLLIGLVGALAASQLLSAILYGVAASDPFTYTSVAGALAGVAVLACFVPLRRALTLNVIVALRQE